jgi:maltose alpha-D-glucosyltransferase/alpha-amylase
MPRATRTGDGREPLWYRDAIFYELRIRAFYDSDGDGIGDFKGLAEKLDYLQDLGVTTLWLLPFYPSPLRDDGYDISDFTTVHPDCGTLEDFKIFLREAHRRGLRVVTELVINHTSDQHPWFQRARRSPKGSRFRDYYVWSDTPDRYREARIIFKDFERSNWTWDDVADAYYWHRFYFHQPDLNFDHPDVRKAVFRTLDFWLNLGVDGLRLDAIPYLYERDGTNCENLAETHRFLKELRAHVDRNYDDRMLLAEANQWPEDAVAYFGSGDECHMAFHFPVMPRLFMALHMEDRFPILDILQQTPEINGNCQWALFLRNHDELTLEMVTDEERDYMYRVYAHDAQARINLGIRRRLAPLLGNDRRRIELMNALLFSLPGTPVLYYGDEIGMGDNFYLGDRNGVRTPMQWTGDRNAGFSRANPQRLYLPVIVDPEYHYESHNVETQQNNLHSLLFWMKRLIALRKQHKAFGRGAISFLTPSNRKVLAFIRTYESETLLIVANLSRFVEYVELDLSAWKGMVAVELFGKKPFPPIGDLPYLLTLGPHSFYWFSLERPSADDAAARQAAAGEMPLPTLHARGSWQSVLAPEGRSALANVLAPVLRRRGWFSGAMAGAARVTILDVVELPCEQNEAFLVVLRAEAAAVSELYVVPLAFADGAAANRIRDTARHAIVAEIETVARQGTKRAILYDAVEQPAIALALLDVITRRRTLRGDAGEVVPSHTSALRSLRGPSDVDVTPVLRHAETYLHEVVYGERLLLKVLRGIAEGINAELEIGRFLAEQGSFVHVAPVAGALEYRAPRRLSATIAILQGWVPNEGDALRFTVDQVQQFFQRILTRPNAATELSSETGSPVELIDQDPPPLVHDTMGSYLEFARTLGMRTAELHLALSRDTDDPAFAPEDFTMLYQRSLYQSLRNQTLRVLALLRDRMNGLPAEVQPHARAVLEAENEVLRRFAALRGRRISATRIRHHGDFELKQVLYTGRDFVVVDLAASDAQTASERRVKASPLRDVASMLWSLHHAARGGLVGDGAAALVRPEDVVVLQPWAYFFAHWAGSNYLRGYLQQAGDARFVPGERRDLAALLTIFGLEKCLDEVEREIDRRPGWLRIPLRGILDVLRME